MCGLQKESTGAIVLTVILGSFLLFNQGIELKEASFSIGERVYGSVFLTLTGLHGFHVFLGLFLLIIREARVVCRHLTCINHASVEISI